MSTDLPYIEGHIDALASTIWWSLDLKFGRLARPRIRNQPNFVTSVIDHLRLIWDSVAIRFSLAIISPFILQYIFDIQHPLRLALNLIFVCVTWPWIYQIFIYTYFLDPLRHLPGPKGHWLFGLGLGFPNEHLGVHQQVFAKTLAPESYPAGLFTYTALGIRRIVPFTPSAVSYFSNSRNYVKTEITRNFLRRLSGDGLLVVDGTEHRRQRKLLNPAFTTEHIKLLVPVFWTKACELRNLLSNEGMSPKEYNVFPSLVRTTLDIIGLTGFGYDFGALKDPRTPIAQAYFTIFDNTPETWIAALLLAVYPFLENLPFSWIKRGQDAKKIILEAATTIIDDKSDNTTEYSRDILGCMLQENRRLENLGEQSLTRDEMIYQILTFLVAGHETTSAALAWALYELSEYPEIQSRLREEIHTVLGKSFDPSKPITYDRLDRMSYLNNVCREVLRVDPPVPMTVRQATIDDVFEGVMIPKDSLILFPTLVINMNPSTWGSDAEHFYPERWDTLKDVPNSQFFTFQHGPHACIGRKFAETEMRVIVAVLIGSFEFHKVPGRQVEKYSLITMRPRNGLYLNIQEA